MPYTLPHPDAKPSKLDPGNVPIGLRHLIPLAEKYGVNDDCYRAELLESLDESEEQELMGLFDDWTDELDAWLCGQEADSSSPSNEYVTFTCLTMAAEFVRVRHKKRGT